MLFPYRLTTINTQNIGRTVFVGDTIWKYLASNVFDELLKTGLKFTVTGKWLRGDANEAAYPGPQLQLRDEDPLKRDLSGMTQQEIDKYRLDLSKLQYLMGVQNGKLFKNYSTDELLSRTIKYHEQAFASCFCVDDKPSEYMFENHGTVAVRFSREELDKELDKLPSFFIAGFVEYESEDWFPVHEDAFSVLFHKGREYIHEKEYRVVFFDKDRYCVGGDPCPRVQISINKCVTGVAISPAMKCEEREVVEDIAKAHGIDVL